MITRNGINIELTNDALIVEGISIPLLRESDRALPEYERGNRREELLLSIAELCAEKYGLQLLDPCDVGFEG
jgi:hypothetical protein